MNYKKLLPERGEGTAADHLLSTAPSAEEMDISEKSNACTQRRNFKSYAIVGSITFLIFMLYYFLDQRVHHHSASGSTNLNGDMDDKKYLHCGNSPAEARALGCRFELMSYSWLPEPCIDQELEEEFQALGFQYFEDIEGTHPMSHETVLTGDHIVFASWGEHMWHCSFMWKKLVKVASGVKGSGGFSKSMLLLNHTEHCTSKMMEEPRAPLDLINTRGTPAFGACIYEENPWAPFLEQQ